MDQRIRTRGSRGRGRGRRHRTFNKTVRFPAPRLTPHQKAKAIEARIVAAIDRKAAILRDRAQA